MSYAVGSSTVRVHQSGLVNFIARRTGSRELAEDIAQETWIAVNHFRGECSLRHYLHNVAYKNIVNWYRQKYRRPHVSLASDSYILDALFVAFTSEDPDHAMQRLALHSAVDDMSEPFRETLRLWLQGYDTGQISEILVVPANTIRSRLRRARERLTALLART